VPFSAYSVIWVATEEVREPLTYGKQCVQVVPAGWLAAVSSAKAALQVWILIANSSSSGHA